MKIHNIQDISSPAQGSMSTVFITGVTGQDGSHMIDYLLKNTKFHIIGGARRLSVDNHENIKHLNNEPRFQLVNFDLTDSHSVYKLVDAAQPDYFINFAAQSFVASSWDFARQTWQTNSTAVLDCLEAIRCIKPTCRFYNAGSSEEFGNIAFSPQNETHPLRPRSPYGASKAAARQLVKVYRESFGMYAVQGWLFNHEGTRRGSEFVSRKITQGVARIVKEMRQLKKEQWHTIQPIELGNLDAKRDWSDAEDCVVAVWKMLNQESHNLAFPPLSTDPDAYYTATTYQQTVAKKWIPLLKDYVVASGESHSIREFVEEAFSAAGVDGMWFSNTKGDPLTERFTLNDGGIVVPDVVLVKVNPKFYRPAEVEVLWGDSSLIRKELEWQPKINFKQLVEKMVKNDLQKV